MKSDICDPYFRQMHVRKYRFRHRFVRKFSSVKLQLMTERERDRSLRVGRWDLLVENRV